MRDSSAPENSAPIQDKTIVFARCGRTYLGRKKTKLSQVIARQSSRIREVADHGATPSTVCATLP